MLVYVYVYIYGAALFFTYFFLWFFDRLTNVSSIETT